MQAGQTPRTFSSEHAKSGLHPTPWTIAGAATASQQPGSLEVLVSPPSLFLPGISNLGKGSMQNFLRNYKQESTTGALNSSLVSWHGVYLHEDWPGTHGTNRTRDCIFACHYGPLQSSYLCPYPGFSPEPILPLLPIDLHSVPCLCIIKCEQRINTRNNGHCYLSVYCVTGTITSALHIFSSLNLKK